MIRFDGEKLFDTGPSRLTIGGTRLRHASQPAVDGEGEAVAGQGRSSRPITQRGTLRADSCDALIAQRDAIEARLDGLAHELIDGHGRSWSSVMMLSFEPGEIERLGPRWKLDYRIEYAQLLV